jgi:hypothetical protein
MKRNRIEGAWRQAKDYFRRMPGTKVVQFEGHLAEIIWRAEAKSNVYEAFFGLLRQVYLLNGPAHFSKPLFNTWSGLTENIESQLYSWEIRPGEHLSNLKSREI